VLARYAGPPLPVAEDVCERHVCLPVHSDMTDAEVDEVLAAVAQVGGELAESGARSGAASCG
jgi:perosamine synthetase